MDWKSIIADLRSDELAGMTQVEIAEAAGCSQALVSDLSRGQRGRRLSHGIGERLLALHRLRVPSRYGAGPDS